MKLRDYVPTKRWVLCFPIMPEQTASGIFLAPGAEGGETPRFEIIAVGPLVEEYKKGQEVIIEPGTRIMEIRFEDTTSNHPVSFLDHSIMGLYIGKKATKLIDPDQVIIK